MKQLRSIEEVPENVNVILRMDTDLPFENETILDNSRLKKTIPTIRYLLEKNCPHLKNLMVRIEAHDSVKKYLEKRPVTAM